MKLFRYPILSSMFVSTVLAIEPSEKVEPLAPAKQPQASSTDTLSNPQNDEVKSTAISPEEVQRRNESLHLGSDSLPNAKAKNTSTAFLGISIAPLPQTLAEHLKISQGCLVKMVSPDSPAGQAGIEVNDVIITLDSTPLQNQATLTEIITQHKPGDVMQVKLIKQGTACEKQITLGNRPANLAQNFRRRLPMHDPSDIFETMPPDMAENMKRSMDRMNQMQQNNDQIIEDMQRNLNSAFQKRLENLSQEAEAQNNANVHQSSTSTIRLMDTQGAIQISRNNGDTKVSVFRQDGSTDWSGPWNTEQDKTAAPADVRARVEALNIQMGEGNSMQLKFHKDR